MDGSTSTPSADRSRLQISRAFSNRTSNQANAQSELFEQLLSISFEVQAPPEKSTEPPDSTSASATQSTNSSKDKPESEQEEDSEVSAPVAAVFAQSTIQVVDNPISQATPEVAADSVADRQAVQAVETTSTSQSDEENSSQATTNVGEQTATLLEPRDTASVNQAEDLRDDTAIPSASDDPLAPVSAVQEQGRATNKKSLEASSRSDELKHEAVLDDVPRKAIDSNEHPVAQSHSETAVRAETVNPPSEDRNERRDDKREKWYERKSEAVTTQAVELLQETNKPETADQLVDLPGLSDNLNDLQSSKVDLIQPIENAAGSPPNLSTSSVPAAIPTAASVLQQSNVLTSSAAAVEKTTSNSEAVNAAATGPTRTIGSQVAKPNSKDRPSEPGLSQQERVRVIQRIARSFNRISAEGGAINLRLHPEHLGSVSVQVRLEGKSLSARLSTETAAARDAIMQDLPALRQRLADQGFDVTKFQVEVAGNGADATFSQTNGQSQFGQSENRFSGAQTDYRRVAALRESRAATSRQIAPLSNVPWQSASSIDLQA